MATALDGAVLVFREHGYHTASLAHLGPAMKLANGSIYKAFSDKRALFLAAFDHYVGRRNAALQQLLDARAAGLEKLQVLLEFYAQAASGTEGRHGCLVVGSAAELSTYDPEMAGKVTAALQNVETRMRDLIQIGQADGSIAAHVDADAVATTLLCVLQGLRVVGKVGRSRAVLMAVVNQATRLLA
ncbi:TetR/AcrR family transcriptional regulator [Lichenicoccus sp.]|uniref:TetR/AcrR family transcriptional regulator n=1 Tax=Lichenicoccus sp. TaxID=2781899 RepID=UPI003D0CFC7A